MKEKSRCFIDSNVWLYLLDRDIENTKYKIAKEIVRENTVILSVQVVNEVGNNLRSPKKPFHYSEDELMEVIHYFFSSYFTFVDMTKEVYLKASELRKRYGFGYYDGIIVAAAFVGLDTVSKKLNNS